MMNEDLHGGFTVPGDFITGYDKDVSGPLRRFLIWLGLATPKMEWQRGIIEEMGARKIRLRENRLRKGG